MYVIPWYTVRNVLQTKSITRLPIAIRPMPETARFCKVYVVAMIVFELLSGKQQIVVYIVARAFSFRTLRGRRL